MTLVDKTMVIGWLHFRCKFLDSLYNRFCLAAIFRVHTFAVFLQFVFSFELFTAISTQKLSKNPPKKVRLFSPFRTPYLWSECRNKCILSLSRVANVLEQSGHVCTRSQWNARMCFRMMQYFLKTLPQWGQVYCPFSLCSSTCDFNWSTWSKLSLQIGHSKFLRPT